MTIRYATAALGLAVMLTGPVSARDPDSETGSRAQERFERDSERAEERAARFVEDQARIEARATEDPDRAIEERARLEADRTKDEAEAAEEAAEREAERVEDLAEEREDEAEDAAELAARGDDSASRGSSSAMRDLGASEGIDHDEDGFPVRRGEVVGIDLDPATTRAAEVRGFRIIDRQRLPALNRELVRLRTPEGMSAPEARNLLRRLDPRAVVDLVHYYGMSFAAGASAKPVKAAAMAPRSAAPLVIGIIDTAVTSHRALGAARLISRQEGAGPGAPVEHGTAVASIVAAHGRATIYSANIFRGPPGQPFTSADVIAGALEWLLSKDVATINMSLAGPRNAILDRLVRDALARGRSVVAAAGNGGPSAPPAYPAAVPGVIAVTAVDGDLRVYRHANRGRYITVAAPGVGVVAAHAYGGMARFTGTSFAAPHVAGLVARCRANGFGANVCLARLRDAARDLGSAGFDEIYGYGFVK